MAAAILWSFVSSPYASISGIQVPLLVCSRSCLKPFVPESMCVRACVCVCACVCVHACMCVHMHTFVLYCTWLSMQHIVLPSSLLFLPFAMTSPFLLATRNAQKGSYIMQPHKLRDIMMPDLTGFKVSWIHGNCLWHSWMARMHVCVSLRCIHVCTWVLYLCDCIYIKWMVQTVCFDVWVCVFGCTHVMHTS